MTLIKHFAEVDVLAVVVEAREASEELLGHSDGELATTFYRLPA